MNVQKPKYFCLHCVHVACYKPCVLQHFISSKHSLFVSYETGQVICMACCRPVANPLTDGAFPPSVKHAASSSWELGRFFLQMHTEPLPSAQFFPGLRGLCCTSSGCNSLINSVIQCIVSLPHIRRAVVGASPALLHVPRHSFLRDRCSVCELERLLLSFFRMDSVPSTLSQSSPSYPPHITTSTLSNGFLF